ncbi:zinc finger, RING/FYVE/PHD-type, Ubiquitin conjugation factor E4 [Artemisia annua]|uniref:Zinc finger, RING/FYVE/PHD-type, Ubiquitin conjugation factor E4 n=1 Tax=Artemisia annua TaxID=35608 RepID=A0A2U1M0H5_ARTAN|nr:zinc finger, RING/FYVE/PHD-type, Ubiquitin conjugation factor E4 [Artemisia annua]
MEVRIVNIYVLLARGDHENIFPSAITKDGQSYKDQAFDDLGNKAKEVASEAIDAEAIFADIPDEFLDPIQN